MFASNAAIIFGQRRPVRKTPVAKPATATEAKPEPTPLPKAKSPAEQFYVDGLKCTKEDYDCQVSNYTKAINLGLSTKEVYKNRGNAYLQRKDIDKALADFSKLIELDPNDTSSYKNRGKIYLENLNSPQAINAAIRDFTSAIDLEPKDVEAFVLRGTSYLSLNDTTKGIADIDKAIQFDSKNIQLLMFKAKMLSGYTNELDKSVEIYSKVISIQPDYVDAYKERANIFKSQQKYDLAIKEYSTIAAQFSKDTAPHIAIAEIYVANNNLNEAIKAYSKAIDLAPEPDLLLKRAGLYRDVKKYTEAGTDITKVIEKSPGKAKAYEIRCYLEKMWGSFSNAMRDCSIAVTLDNNLYDAPTFRKQMLEQVLDSNIIPISFFDHPDVQIDKQFILPSFNENYVDKKKVRIGAGIEARKSPTALNFVKLASSYDCKINKENTFYCLLAESYYSKAIELDPDLAEAYVGRANARSNIYSAKDLYENRKDYQAVMEILQDIQKAIELDPSQVEAVEKPLNDTKSYIIHIADQVDSEPERLSYKFRNEVIQKASENSSDNVILHFQNARNFESGYLVRHGRNLQFYGNYLRKILEFYNRSKKTSNDQKILAETISILSKKDVDRVSSAGKSFWDYKDLSLSSREKFLDDMIAKFPDVWQIYQLRCEITDYTGKKVTKTTSPLHCAKAKELYKSYIEKRNESVLELLKASQSGIDFAEGLRASALTEPVATSDLDRQLLEEEIKRAAEEDIQAKNTGQSLETRRLQLKEERRLENAKMEAKTEELQRQATESKARLLNSALGLFNTAIQVATNNPRSTSQVPQPNTPSASVTTQTTGTSTAGTGQSTNRGNQHLKKGEIIISDQITESQKEKSGDYSSPSTDCLVEGYTRYTHQWSGWQPTSIDGLQWRNKGPIRACGNLINDEKGKVSYSWHFAYKNTTDTIMWIDCQQIAADGQPVNTCGGLIGPGGVVKHLDASNHTFSDAKTVTFKLKYLETCTAIRMSKETPYGTATGWGCQ